MNDKPRMSAYLGDGLYAEWDGFNIRLWTPRDERESYSSPHEVYLDAMVLHHFMVFVDLIKQAERLDANKKV
jgi:hypothetical protein